MSRDWLRHLRVLRLRTRTLRVSLIDRVEEATCHGQHWLPFTESEYNLSAAGLRGWGKLMYVAWGAVGDDRYGLQMREVLWLLEGGPSGLFNWSRSGGGVQERRCSFAPALGLCLNDLLCYDPTPALRSGLCQRNATPGVSGLTVFPTLWAFT